MRLTYIAIAALPCAFASVTRLTPRCNADNCARAVTGTKAQPALEVRQTDCANFQTATVYPPAETETSYNAYADTTIYPSGTTDMTVQATEVPSYVSKPCGTSSPAVSSRYASACSCFGFPATATTAPAETVTVYTTVPEPAPTTCQYINQPCDGDSGQCGYNVVGGVIQYGDLVCAGAQECAQEKDQCMSASDCAAGEACINGGAFCSTNTCQPLE